MPQPRCLEITPIPVPTKSEISSTWWPRVVDPKDHNDFLCILYMFSCLCMCLFILMNLFIDWCGIFMHWIAFFHVFAYFNVFMFVNLLLNRFVDVWVLLIYDVYTYMYRFVWNLDQAHSSILGVPSIFGQPQSHRFWRSNSMSQFPCLCVS